MNVGVLSAVTAVITFLFGVATLLAPEPFLSNYGLEMTPSAVLEARFFGALAIGFAVIDWYARRDLGSQAGVAVVVGNLSASVVGLAVALIGSLTGVVNALGWTTVALFALLVLGWGFYAIGARRA